MDTFAEYQSPSSQRRRQRRTSGDFYADIADSIRREEERKRQREAVTRIDPNPDQAGEARRVARETGTPVPAVRQNLPAFREDQQRSDVARAARDPRLGPWLGQNADVAGDDVPNLLQLGAASDRYNAARRFQPSSFFEGNAQEARQYRENASPAQKRNAAAVIYAAGEPSRIEDAQNRGVIGQIAGSLRAGTAQASGGAGGLLANVAGIVGASNVERELLLGVEATDEYAAANRGRSDSFVADSLYGGVESTPIAVGGLLSGSSKFALGLFFSTSAGNSYAEARGAGLGVGRSTLFGTSQGAIEVITEKLPTGRLLDLVKGKGSASNAVKRFLIGEAAGEQAATILQDFNSWATLNPDKPFSEFLAERPEAAARTFLGTVSGAGPQAAVAYGLNRAFREEARLQTSADQLDALDALIDGSAQSKARGRDPIAFKALLDQLAGDGENIFVPASSIAEFNQDYRDDNFWGDYADQIDEGLATGGSVAVPLGAAAARLAGTPDWDAISGDVRVGPDGASRNEIEEANAELEALKVEAGDRLDAEDRAARREAAPRERLREGIRSQLMNAGMTPDVANANSEIVAALFETEAANLGREVTGNEFSDAVSVQRVLPDLLASPQATETLDLIVNAMRQGNDPQVGIGESLLQFIANRGGINDPGGDLKSMGLPKRYIRNVGESGGAFSDFDNGEFGIDTTLRAAIEAGYFSDLAQVENEQGVSTLDTQALLDGIEQELRGEKVYSEVREDQYRAGGEELRQILESRGVDPDTASDVEIRQAVEAFEREQRQEFDQLPQTIEIDGVERSTVNSEGQQLAATEEGVRNFWAWFGDSKVVDADGRPLVVYHGSDTTFEAFTVESIGKNATALGYGFYFAEREDVAKAYEGEGGGVTAVYLAASNPVDEAAPISNADAVRLVQKAVELEVAKYPDEIADYRDSFMSNVVDTYSTSENVAVREVAQLLANNDTMADALAELANIMGGKELALAAASDGIGVDGIHVPDFQEGDGQVWVIFDPAQIKSVNNTGSFDPNDARILYQSAFHGSPHQFDKFSTDAIGTGEGAQAYGWGLYFAGKREIAEHYRNTLSQRGQLQFDGQDLLQFLERSPDELREIAQEIELELYEYDDVSVERQKQANQSFGWASFAAALNGAQAWQSAFSGDQFKKSLLAYAAREEKEANREDYMPDKLSGLLNAAYARALAKSDRISINQSGRLFEVDIPEDNEYLLWDKGFWEQPDIVLKGLEAALSPEDLEVLSRGNSNGETIYDFIARKAVNNDFGPRSTIGDRAASTALFDAGIAGIKYLDGTSRTDGDGTFNYVVFDDSRVSIKAYEQNQGQGPQGQIAIGDSQSIIKLFETANLSTFQHEMAHFWLERFKGNALSSIDTDGNPAARQTFADYETLKGWFADNGFAVAEDGKIPVEAHELFARSWERYLMEGKAPKPSLNGVFRKFAAWMRSIYRLVKNLNAPITPEVREVMDRMLATQDEIAMAAEDRAVQLMFDNALDAGMSEAEALRYGELADEARSQAEEELEGKVMRSIRAREQKQWRAQEKVVRAEVTEAVESRPVFKALDNLRGDYRLDRDFIVAEYGEDALKLLPAGVPPLYRKGGDNADQIAEMVGFKSGDQMVRELMGMETMRKEMKAKGDKRSVKKATIDQEVAIEMHDRFGDPLGDGTIEREAQAAIQNERQGERIELELKALGTQTNRRPTPYALAQKWAADRIASGVVADTISGEAQQRYTRTAAKASRDAMKAFARGDTEAAFEAKQTEMLHNALAREASKASEAVDKAVKRMGDLAKQRTVKSMSQDYLDRIHGLLEGYEFKRVSQKAINARDEYARWAQEQTEAGHDVVAVERLAQTGKNYSRLTVEELLALNDAVRDLAFIGRKKQKLLDGKEERDFNEVVGEALASTNELPQLKAKDQFGGEGWLEAIGGKFLSLNAALRKMEDVFDRLDAGRPNGVFNRVVFRPIVEAQSREHDMLDAIIGPLKDAMAKVPKKSVKRWQDRRTIDELPGVDKYGRQTGEPATFLGEELILIAMNMGNRGNMEKLIGGYGWDKQLGGMDAAQALLMDVLNRELSVEDWQYVQTVWDTIDSLWPEISALEKRVNGFAPEKVEAVPLETAAGQLRGGYFPVVYDPASRVGARNLEVEENGLFASNYFRSTTRAGSTKERTSFKGPLNLSLGVINRHVAEVVHDITHREAVMNADKFLSDSRVRQAIIDTMGPEIEAQMRPWLGHIANEWATDREVNSDFERFVKATRTNATVVGLGFRVSTMMLQVSGYANSIERIGIMPVMRGIRKMVSGPEAWTFALENSNELKTRMTSMDRDIRDNARKLASKQKNVLDAAQQFAFHGIGYMDRLVSIGSWHGAYDKALRQGMNHDDAVYEADKAIRQSQGSGAAKDMARVQRGTGRMGEAIKLSTMFYSYSSAFYQRQVKFAQDTRDAVRERDAAQIPDLAARFLWLNIVPALLSQWLAGRWPEDDEDEAAWVMGELLTAQFQAIPFGREIAGGLQSGFGYSYTPAEGFGKSVVAVVKDGQRVVEGEDTKRATRNALELIGYSTGKVPGQIASSTQFLVDVGYGEQDPDTIAEWWTGLTKGKIKE